MALINCYRYKLETGAWKRDGTGMYKIRAGGVAQGQPLGFDSFKLQRLLIAISTEFAKLNAQFRGHMDESMLSSVVRGAITEAGLTPGNAPDSVTFGTDDLGGGSYKMKLLVIDRAVNANQGLGIAVTTDRQSNAVCISCGLSKTLRKTMDPKVKSPSVIPASFWVAIVPSALTAIGVKKLALTGEDEILKNAMMNAGNEAAGTYAKPGADAQAISMCSDCESRQADFTLLQRHEKGEKWLRNRDNAGKDAEIRTFIGTQFLGSTGIGNRDEMVRVTYNVARRVAGAFERQIFNALDKHIRSLPPDTVAPTTPTPHKTPITVMSTKFASQPAQQLAMGQQVLPQMMKQVESRAISTWVGITSRQARDWSARESVKARHWVDHISLKAGLQVSWSTHRIDDGTPLKAKLEQIGMQHGPHRAKKTWQGLPGEPPLVVYLAQNIDAFLQAVVEFAVLFSGLTRKDQTKDEKGGVVKV